MGILNRKQNHKPVLIVEDKRENQILLETICSQNNLKTFTASNGKEGLEIAKKEKISIYIVDLMLPIMDGRTFIEELKKIDQDSIVIVQSALDSNSAILDVMRLGVYDYFFKPLDIDLFKITLNKAIEYKYLKDLEKEMLLNESIKLREQLEWLNYKENLRITGKDSYQKNSIVNLSTSLSQGAGIGASISLIDTIKGTIEEDGQSYKVDKELLETLFINNEFTRKTIFGLHEVVKLMEAPLNLIEINSKHLIEKIPEILNEVIHTFEQKNLKISFPKIVSDCLIEIDLEKFSLILEELVVNAYKYSVQNSTISIFANISGTYFCLSVKNDNPDDIYSGIPVDQEKLVLEPFYRIHPPVEDIIEVEKLSLGLGLTVVDFIINKLSGMFFIHNAIDHTGKVEINCVLAEIFLPIKMKKG